jgi:trimethylamine--corrinoid protein Co-methyltransferase
MDVNMQTALELMMSIYSCCLAGSNLIAHIGGLEAAMTFSMESVILGDEIVGMIKRIMKGIPLNNEAMSLGAIHSVGPAGHFLDSQHTFQHFRKEQWQPTVLNRNAFEVWLQEGSKPMRQRIKEKLNEIIRTHPARPLSNEVQAQISKIIREIK